jgi:hypothetical protein
VLVGNQAARAPQGGPPEPTQSDRVTTLFTNIDHANQRQVTSGFTNN